MLLLLLFVDVAPGGTLMTVYMNSVQLLTTVLASDLGDTDDVVVAAAADRQ